METRQIKFRAKRLGNNEWAEGDLVHYNGNKVGIQYYNDIGDGIYVQVIHQVDPRTVCQFTGLKDKDGKEIWEHDIIKLTHENGFVQKAAVEYFQNSFIGMDGGIHIQLCLYGGCDRNTLKRVENLGSKFDIKEHKVWI